MKTLKWAILYVAVCMMHNNSVAQEMILDTTLIRYFEAFSEPPSDWNTLDFDDSNWKNTDGVKMFNFGEGPIPEDVLLFKLFGLPIFHKKLDTASSVYFRYYFDIDTVANFKELVLFCDFDDGFVASINGVEFARVNMGAQMSPTTFDQLADRSHEMEFLVPDSYPVLGHYIDSTFINENIVAGKNVLSVEVHNDSLNVGDLSWIGLLYDHTNEPYDWSGFLHRYKKSVQLDSTKLPIVVIETDEYGVPWKRIEVDGTIGIVHNDLGKYNKPEDGFNHLFSNISIEQRGESSSSFVKKSFDFELHDVDGNDTSISVLGMPREADWVLQGPFADKSQIRNALFYELARKTGHWTPRVEFCEVIFNGEYLGLYNVIEKIKRDSNRINIGKLRPEEIAGTDLTGGYILKHDKSNSKEVQIVYPKASNLQEVQKQYIEGFINNYESVLFSNDGLDNEIGYKKYIDETTLLDYVIIAELGKNCDSYLFSTYFYKNKDDRDPRIKFGPIWDFDLCMGNASWQNGAVMDEWQFEYNSNKRFHIERLFEDTELVQAFNDRWFELRESFLHKDSLYARIDELTEELAEPIKRNYEVWPVIDKKLFFPAYDVYSYNEEITHIKQWLDSRLNWIDNNISQIYYDTTIYTGVEDEAARAALGFEANIYPNPIQNEMYIDLNITVAGELEIELIDVQGRVVSVIESAQVEPGSYKVYWNRNGQNVNPGFHLVSFKIDGKLQIQVKAIIE